MTKHTTRPGDPGDPADPETLLRTVMLRHDDEAPGLPSLNLLASDDLTSRRGSPSGRTVLTGLAAAAVVVAAVTAAFVTTGSRSERAAAPSTSASTSQSPSVSPSGSVGPSGSTGSKPIPPPITDSSVVTSTVGGRRVISGPGSVAFSPIVYRRLQLYYPDLGYQQCQDIPGGIRYAGPIRFAKETDCSRVSEPALVFTGTDAPNPVDVSPATEHITIDGVPALTGRAGNVVYLVVPSLKVVARYDAGSPEQTAKVLPTASIIIGKDHYGCPLTMDPKTPPHTDLPGAAQALVPGTPTAVLDCSYQQSHVLSPGLPTDLSHDPSEVKQALNALTERTTSCTPRPNQDRHVFITYADGSVLDIRARYTSCYDVIQYTNGTVTRIGSLRTVPLPV